MEEEKKKEKLFSVKAPFQYFSSDLDKISEGEASLVINNEEIIIVPLLKEPYIIKLIDILEINPVDYKVFIPLSPNGKLVISELGYEFENFLRILKDARNEILAKYLLMEEKVIRKNIKAEYSYLESSGAAAESGNCNITVYETGLSILPENGKILRIAYCEITDITEGDYKVTVASESGQKMELSKMGYEFDPFKKILSDTINALDLFAQNLVMELDPSLDTLTVIKIARFLRDGKAAMKKDIEKYSPCVWKSLENKIESAGVLPEYNYLKSISHENQIAIGLKQGLMGSMTSDYIWFLMPVYGSDPKKPGNAIAMEAVPVEKGAKKEAAGAQSADPAGMLKMAADMQKNMTANLQMQKEAIAGMGKIAGPPQFKIAENSTEQNTEINSEDGQKTGEEEGAQEESTGKATYFFKILNRADYPKPENLQGLESEVEKLIKKINKAMISINFRREPIYIEEEKLYEPDNVKYRFAISKIAELREIREKFIGRAIHISFNSWKAGIEKLLAFNVSTMDEKAKFKK